MKTRFTALLVGALLTASSLCAQAQPKANDKTPDKPRWTAEELMQRKAEHMASTLMLDEKSEAKFVMLYAQYLKELKECRERYREEAPRPEREKLREPREPLTDAEIEKRIENRFNRQRQMLDIREKYYKDFKKMLTPKQLLKVFEGNRPAVGSHRHWVPKAKRNARRDYRDNQDYRNYRPGCCPWYK